MLNYLIMNKITIVGAGKMAIEYAKVFESLQIDYSVIGNSERSARIFEKNTTKEVVRGGLKKALKNTNELPNYLIIAVQVEKLYELVNVALDFKIPYILVEKPGALEINHLESYKIRAQKNKCSIYIAYNRRFYDSVLLLQDYIVKDDGLTNLVFDFTEFTQKIDQLTKSQIVLDNWIISNSSHVIDLAFYIAGSPVKLQCNTSSNQEWNNMPAIFSGSGITDNDVLFSYSSNWKSVGNWKIEVTTKKSKYLLNPLENLKRKTLKDRDYITLFSDEGALKPGLSNMVKSFLKNDFSKFCSIDEQIENLKIMNMIKKLH